MRLLITSVALMLAAALPAMAQTVTDDVVVRTTIRPEGGAVLGQPVRVLVDVLFPGAMSRPPRVAIPDMAGAQVLRYETQATTMSDTIGGKPYVGQRFEFALYARRGGRLEISAPSVTVLDPQGNAVDRVLGKAGAVEITVPPEVDPARPLVAADRLALGQQWSPASASALKAGDALVRTITRTAAGVPGMAMLDLGFAAPPGVRVYVDPPQGDDRIERGEVTGHRVDRVTYVFEVGGSFVIPDVAQPWWDLSAGRLRRAEGSGVTVFVTAASVLAKGTDRIERWLFVAVTMAGAAVFASWAWPRAGAALVAIRARRQGSERKAYRDLEAACRQGDARSVYRAFATWRRRAPRADALSLLATEIESVLFAGAPWSHDKARAFARRCEGARRGLRHTESTAAGLPPLNPPLAVRRLGE